MRGPHPLPSDSKAASLAQTPATNAAEEAATGKDATKTRAGGDAGEQK